MMMVLVGSLRNDGGGSRLLEMVVGSLRNDGGGSRLLEK
jgi:hypothetical protein